MLIEFLQLIRCNQRFWESCLLETSVESSQSEEVLQYKLLFLCVKMYCVNVCAQLWTGLLLRPVRTLLAGCSLSWTQTMTCIWTKLSWLPLIWTSMKCAYGPSSTPVIHTVMAKFPQRSGASAFGEKVSFSISTQLNQASMTFSNNIMKYSIYVYLYTVYTYYICQ